ncbi:MAG: hypothetical protein L6R37_002486 [Teloschistes peruensis]|nr:MAG: hypothetical protein L6R37_002486 [Teloschistes peruensis]
MAASTKAGLKDNPAMSFVMLTDSQVVPPQATANGPKKPHSKSITSKEKGISPSSSSPDTDTPNLSHQISSTTHLFEILSAQSDIDHPICTECTDLLLTNLQSRLSAAQKERDTYISFLRSLNTTAPSPQTLQKAEKSLKESRAAESKAFAELLALEKQKRELDEEIASLEAESLALDKEEQEFWRDRNAFSLTLAEFQNERDALQAAYEHDAAQLERLQRTNVYNDCFCISHDGQFGTINGLRLGRLPPQQSVEWAEINAALGTTAFLLATVAEKLGFVFQGYRIRPMGSTSHIEKLAESTTTTTTTTNTPAASTATIAPPQTSPTYPSSPSSPPQITAKPTPLDLFSSGDLPLGARFLHRRLDAGMVALLDCIRQLGDFVENTSSASSTPQPRTAAPGAVGGASGSVGVRLPYRISRDKVHDVSIRLGAGTDETWTRACKYALTCCKFLLAFASNVGAAAAGGGTDGGRVGGGGGGGGKGGMR